MPPLLAIQEVGTKFNPWIPEASSPEQRFNENSQIPNASSISSSNAYPGARNDADNRTGFIGGTSFTFTSTSFADSNTIYTITVTTLLTGTLTGSGVDYATLIVHPDGSFNAQHLSTCNCKVNGLSGVLSSVFNLSGSLVTQTAAGQCNPQRN